MGLSEYTKSSYNRVMKIYDSIRHIHKKEKEWFYIILNNKALILNREGNYQTA